jgi:hypothetical protein
MAGLVQYLKFLWKCSTALASSTMKIADSFGLVGTNRPKLPRCRELSLRVATAVLILTD